MIIAVAGAYSAPTEEQRQQNLLHLNKAAAALVEKGHTPLIGVNAALPVVQQLNLADPYETIMRISLAVIGQCDALLFLGESPGANREKEIFESKGLPVYYTPEEVPDSNKA